MSNYNIYKYTKINRQKAKIYLKLPQFEMAEIALKGQYDFISIMVPSDVPLKEKCLSKRKNILSQKLR